MTKHIDCRNDVETRKPIFAIILIEKFCVQSELSEEKNEKKQIAAGPVVIQSSA